MDSFDRPAQERAEAALDQQVSEIAHSASAGRRDPFEALRYRNFQLLFAGRFIAALGGQMLAVAIGWELFERTNSPLALGLVGLMQVLPVIFLSLFAGQLADRANRRAIVLIAQGMLLLCSLGLAALSAFQGPIALVYGVLLVIGVGVAFSSPAESTLIPISVPASSFASAAAWSSSSWQLASVAGPALGGFLIAVSHGAAPVYLFDAAASLIYIALIASLRPLQQATPAREAATLHSLREGFRFLTSTKVILAAITLDMFAVLLGGATTLLPVFAKDILLVGPVGLGWLRAAPSVGALVMAITLAFRPPMKRAGRALLLAVVGFGAATIVFGFSRSFPLSLLMLVLLGAFDNISVVIRSSLLLLRTPNQMRGRIASVNSLFISASNELGGFESGLVAALSTPVISVVAGGVGTILVVCAVAWAWPEMRRLGALAPESAPTTPADAEDVLA